jgi:hypothetical protein
MVGLTERVSDSPGVIAEVSVDIERSIVCHKTMDESVLDDRTSLIQI